MEKMIPIPRTPEWDAVNAFDAKINLEPDRVIAQRIARKHGFLDTDDIVDEISHALEDAYNIGERRGPLVAAAVAADKRSVDGK